MEIAKIQEDRRPGGGGALEIVAVGIPTCRRWGEAKGEENRSDHTDHRISICLLLLSLLLCTTKNKNETAFE